MKVHGLIPAAGLSTRMGTCKLSLPLGPATVIECAVTALLNAGVTDVLVVLGPHFPELIPLAITAGAKVLKLLEPTLDMRATVERGLDWIGGHARPEPADCWLLMPADHPVVDVSVVKKLIEVAKRDREASIALPTFHGKRGHPALIRWRHLSEIRNLPAGVGLNHFFRQPGIRVAEVPVESESVLWDLDSPEDYARLIQFRS